MKKTKTKNQIKNSKQFVCDVWAQKVSVVVFGCEL